MQPDSPNIAGAPANQSPKSNELKTILLVDDHADSRITTKWFLTHFGYAVELARSAEEGLAIFSADLHDLVISDNSMPGMTGAEMAHIIKLRSPKTPVIMFTGHPPEDTSCINAVIPKPTHLLVLKATVESLLAQPTDPQPRTTGQ